MADEKSRGEEQGIAAGGASFRSSLWLRCLYGLGLILGCWLAMQAVHELGHVMGAWVTGGKVVHVELAPWSISRTDVLPNPDPLTVCWAGPITGCGLPLLLWLALRSTSNRIASISALFAGFCLIANGTYLGSAVSSPVGDAADLLNHGAPLWQLLLFSGVTVPPGVWMWHRLTLMQLGLSPRARPPAVPVIVGLWTAILADVFAHSLVR